MRRISLSALFRFLSIAAAGALPLVGDGPVVVAQTELPSPAGDVSEEEATATPNAFARVSARRHSLAPDASLSDDRPRIGGTRASLPNELTTVAREGVVPESLGGLRSLQQQIHRVTTAAEACTVAVRIGPAQGCGVIITPGGLVLSAAHVAMRPGKTAMLTLPDGRHVTATTLGMNRNVDAGLMQIEPGQNEGRAWPHATLGTSKGLQTGMWCIATGHPGGYEAERGVVTRVGRILALGREALVTDCALIGGDSGGPLFDLQGRLIAVHSRIGNDVADNLHVPIDHYDQSWDRMAGGEAWGFLPGFRPILGVSGNGEAPIARINSVKAGSPAERAGIEAGDRIEVFGDHRVSDFQSLKAAVADTMPGERVKVWLRRGGQAIQVVVEIGRADG